MTDHTVRHGDTYSIRWQITSLADQSPFDLTGWTVTARARARVGKAVTILACTVVSPPTKGLVQHVLTGTLPIGVYDVQIQMVKGSERVTCPTDGNRTLTVEPEFA